MHSSASSKSSGGKTLEFTGRYETVSRGGKGFQAVKRTTFVRVQPPAIELVDWDKVEGKDEDKGKGTKANGRNGDTATLFD